MVGRCIGGITQPHGEEFIMVNRHTIAINPLTNNEKIALHVPMDQ